MKKKIFVSVILTFLIAVLLSLSLVIFVGAAENSSSEVPASAIWKITHKDGSVEYSDTFNGAFSKIADGDTFKLLPTEYNVYLANYATLRPTTKVNITIDLRGTTIIAPETGDVDGQIFNISDSNKGSTVNVLMENAKIFAAPGGRCAFSVGGYTVINIDGGKDGGMIYAGGALNLTANYSGEATYSTVKNMFCYKSTPNMAGMLCSRNTSKLKLIDTYAVGDAACNGSLPLYVRNSGCMILENSHGISLGDSNNVLEFVDVTSETSFTLSRGSTLHGKVKGLSDPALMKIASGTHLGASYTATLLGDSYLSDSPLEITHTVYTSSAVGEETVSQVTLSYPYSVCENIILEDTKTSSSVWKLEGNGVTKYASSLSALSSASYSKATLLCDLEISEATVIELNSALEIDLAGKKLSLSSGADVGYAFIVGGTGDLTLSLGSTETDLLGAAFLRANNKGSINISSSGILAADIIVSKTKSDGALSVDGGSYLSRLGDGFVSEGSISLRNAALTSIAVGNLVLSPENITVAGSAVLAAGGAAIRTDKTLSITSESYIGGKVKAKDIAVGNYTYFTELPEYESISTTLIRDLVEKQVKTVEIVEDAPQAVTSTVSFEYYTREYILSDTKKEDSVWKLTDKNGISKYTDHVYTPFLDLSQYVNYTLLCDLKLSKNFIMSLAGDIKIDISSHKISLDKTYDIKEPLFDISGDGVVELAASGATVDADGATFVFANKIKGVELTLDNSFVNANVAVRATDASIKATGGYYYAKNGVFISTSSIELTSLTAYSNTGATVADADGDVTLNAGTTLIGQKDSRAVSTDARLMVADGVELFGAAAAKEFYSAGKVRMTLKPSFERSNMLVVQERENKEVVLKTMTDGKITETKTKFILSFTTVNITDGLKVGMTLSSDAALDVYVPTSIVNSDPSFTLRIVLSGLLYEAKAQNGTAKTVDGKSYVRFRYSYVYPDAYDETAKITLISGSFTSVKTIGISDYFERAIALTASDELRAVIASYAAYSAECSGVKLAVDSPLSKYAKKLTVYKEAESELLFDYFRSVRYEPSANELRFTPWTSCDYTVNISYKFGDTDMTYTFASKDGAFAIPVYRFVMSGDFVMRFTDSAGEKTVNINLYELAYFAEEGSDTRMLLTLYLAYANALHECVGG